MCETKVLIQVQLTHTTQQASPKHTHCRTPLYAFAFRRSKGMVQRHALFCCPTRPMDTVRESRSFTRCMSKTSKCPLSERNCSGWCKHWFGLRF